MDDILSEYRIIGHLKLKIVEKKNRNEILAFLDFKLILILKYIF